MSGLSVQQNAGVRVISLVCMYLTCRLVSQLCSVFPFMLAIKLSNPNPGVSQLAGPFTTPPMGHMT